MTTSLTLSGVSHDYGDGQVLDSVDLAVVGGEVHALLGMNGAGKSTLVHIATGHLRPTRGRIELDGAPVEFADVADAARRGIVLLAQEVDRALVADATVHENLTAGLLQLEGRRTFSLRRNRERAQHLLSRYGVDLDVDRTVRSLSLFEKQTVSLVRAVASRARILVLDEPTAAFDVDETGRFYALVRALRSDGLGIVFISHRLGEVIEIADRVTVLGGGVVRLHSSVAQTDIPALVTAITGTTPRETSARRPATTVEAAVPVLELRGADLGRGRPPLDLTVHPGEIVSVFGPLGSGKTTLARTLFGLEGVLRARIDGREVRIGTSVQARRAGIALVPEERRAHGLWLDEDVRTHFSLGFRGLVRGRRERAHAEAAIAEYGVVPASPRQVLRRLSGGNQQKVAVGKWAGIAGRRLIVLDEPMKGVDVAAKEALFRSIEDLAASGSGVLYLTQEPDEALRIADRVVVLGRSGVEIDAASHDLTPLDLLHPERTRG